MIPCVLYYDNFGIQMCNPLTLAPLGENGQFVPVQGSPFFFNSPNFFFSYPGQSSAVTDISPNNCQAKEKMGQQTLEQQRILQTEQKSVKRIQNPHRNIYTNITNLILNFIISKKKAGDLLEMIDPTLVNEKLFKFYKYVKDIKTYFCCYFNVDKVKKLFHMTSIPNYNKEFHRILRVAARIILQEKIVICVLTSKKLCPELRTEHLKAKRVILNILKGNSK